MDPKSHSDLQPEIDALRGLVLKSRRLVVLTGAGCSTDSGIPDYRDREGAWKHRQPVQYGDFVRNESTRRRYWARSSAGWPRFNSALPNRAHEALATWESRGHVDHIITQNVDELHQAAGSRQVTDLHGCLSQVICLGCGGRRHRDQLQTQLIALNPQWHASILGTAPDGDANLDAHSYDSFEIVDCHRCGGTLKPDVVFFGESVPRDRVAFAMERVENADALLIVGSSLMVWSGFRFARAAADRRIPIAIVNLGTTRADDLATVKVDAYCSDVLPRIVSVDDTARPA